MQNDLTIIRPRSWAYARSVTEALDLLKSLYRLTKNPSFKKAVFVDLARLLQVSKDGTMQSLHDRILAHPEVRCILWSLAKLII